MPFPSILLSLLALHDGKFLSLSYTIDSRNNIHNVSAFESLSLISYTAELVAKYTLSASSSIFPGTYDAAPALFLSEVTQYKDVLVLKRSISRDTWGMRENTTERQPSSWYSPVKWISTPGRSVTHPFPRARGYKRGLLFSHLFSTAFIMQSIFSVSFELRSRWCLMDEGNITV